MRRPALAEWHHVSRRSLQIRQRTLYGFGTQTKLVLEVRQHLLKVTGVIGLAAARAALELIWLTRDIGTSFAVEVPCPPLPHLHSPALTGPALHERQDTPIVTV